MIKLIFLFTLSFTTLANAQEWTVFYQNQHTQFNWEQIVPLDQYKQYYFDSQGLGIEKSIFTDKSTEFKLNAQFQLGNYANLVGVGASFLPYFPVGKTFISPEFNLGFEYLKTTSNSPYSTEQINFYSKIGPRITYQNVGVGVYNYYSSLFGKVSLQGWSLVVFYGF